MRGAALIPWISAVLRVFCGAVLVYASFDKLDAAGKFAKVIENYHALPLSLVPLAAAVLPWMEFLAGVALCAGWRWRGAAVLFCGLMGIYTLALSWNLLQGVDMNCGCFSLESTAPVTWATVGRDVLLLAAGLGALFFPSNRLALEEILSGFPRKGAGFGRRLK